MVYGRSFHGCSWGLQNNKHNWGAPSCSRFVVFSNVSVTLWQAVKWAISPLIHDFPSYKPPFLNICFPILITPPFNKPPFMFFFVFRHLWFLRTFFRDAPSSRQGGLLEAPKPMLGADLAIAMGIFIYIYICMYIIYVIYHVGILLILIIYS